MTAGPEFRILRAGARPDQSTKTPLQTYLAKGIQKMGYINLTLKSRNQKVGKVPVSSSIMEAVGYKVEECPPGTPSVRFK